MILVKYTISILFLTFFISCLNKEEHIHDEHGHSDLLQVDSPVTIEAYAPEKSKVNVKRISISRHKCKLKDLEFEVETRGMSDGSDEGLYSVFFVYSGKKLIIKNSDNLLTGYSSLENGPCGKLPLISINKNHVALISSIDNRPSPDRLIVSLINLEKFKIVDQMQSDGGEMYYYSQTSFSKKISRGDQFTGEKLKVSGKSYTVLRGSYTPLYTLSVDSDMKLVQTYSLIESYNNFSGKSFFKTISQFESAVVKGKRKHVYYLTNNSLKECIFISSEIGFPKSINQWKCARSH
jgi:hypothetical protein